MEEEFQKNLDVFDTGEIDMHRGRRNEIHGHFDSFMKDKYYDLSADGLSFDDFYVMSEQFFPYKGLPVLYRDILYNLIGYFYAVSEDPDETLDFYKKLIKDNQQYVQRKKNVKFYIEKGCKPEAIDYAEFFCNDGTEST